MSFDFVTFTYGIEYIAYSSYTMCTRGSPDIYTLSPRASGVYIRQTTRAHGITIKYVSRLPDVLAVFGISPRLVINMGTY